MERAELFRAIEDICYIGDGRLLLERIREVLEIDEGPEAPVSPEEWWAATEEEEEKEDECCNEQNYFYIEKSGKAIDAKMEKDDCEYCWIKIGNTTKLKAFVEKYEKRKDEAVVVKLVSKLIEEIKDKPPRSFDRNMDNSEKLAKYVYEIILKKYVKKISTTCYRNIYGGGEKKEFYLELIDVIHAYLRELWVYTVVPQVGEPYNSVIDFYEALCVSGNTSNPVITKIESPAYIIEYIDEDENLLNYCLSGVCILGEGGKS